MFQDLSPALQGWLAGLLDGEGSFTESKGRIKLSIETTDLDVIRKVAVVLGSKVYTRRRSLLGTCKPSYETSIGGIKAMAWMVGLYPMLCRRRQGQIAHTLRNKCCMFRDLEPLSIP